MQKQSLSKACQTKKRFVVAACSRSGTTYISKVMSELGYSCGHERIFNICRIHRMWDLTEPMTAFYEKDAALGDASFLSIPYLGQLPEETIVFHQVRDPTAVIRSHMGIRFFSEEYQPSMYLADEHPQIMEFFLEHCPVIMAGNTEIERCMRYWVEWNEAIELINKKRRLKYMRYRIEDVDQSLIAAMARLLDGHKANTQSANALSSVSKNTNSRPRDELWQWQNLPDGEYKDRMKSLARSYGYDVG